jgi:hypothetical protein
MNLLRKLISACQGISIDCRESALAQSGALEHPLPVGKRLGLWLHLLLCQWCRRYGKQIRFLREAAHEHQDELVEAAPQKLSSAARERIKRQLSETK